MPSINLIATRREEKHRLERNIRRLVLVVAMEFGLVVFLASAMTVRLMTLRAHVDYLSNQANALQPKVDEIEHLEAQTADMQPKVDVLNQARNTTLYWYTAVQTLCDCLPDQTWLSGIDTGGDPTPPPTAAPSADGSAPAPAPVSAGGAPTLIFSGEAPTSNEIGIAMLRMNQHQNISGVTLGAVTDARQGSADLMQFSMTVQLKPNTAQDTITPGFDNTSPAPAAPSTPQARVAQAASPTLPDQTATEIMEEKHV